MINNKLKNYYTMKNIINIKRKLKKDNEERKDLQTNKITANSLIKINENNKNILSKNNLEEKNIYKILKLSNNKINNKDEKKFIEVRKEEDKEIKINKNTEDIMLTNRKSIFQSKNNRLYKNSFNNQSDKEYLNKDFEAIKLDEIKRQTSISNQLNEKNLNYINNDNIDINKPTQKSHSYFKYDYQNNIHGNKKYNTEEFNNCQINMINNNHKINVDKEKIIFWLVDLKLITKEEINTIILPKLISDGKLLCEIINACEKQDYIIEDISNEISIKENALMNIKKALEHLNNISDFPKDNIKDYEPIFEIDNNIIWKLLDDLYNYYSDKEYYLIDYKEKKNKDILTDINNINIIDKTDKISKKKKSLKDISDLYFNINNNKKNKTKSNKNINRKNNFFKSLKNNKDKYRTFYSTKNNENYNYSHKNLSIIINKENKMNNKFNLNHNKDNDNESIKLVNNEEMSKNFIYYVNALKNYFDKGRDNPKELIREVDLNNKNEMISNYSTNNYDSLYNNNDNLLKLYFDYSNNIYFNNINKKSRYSYNPIKPYYYNTNYVGIKRTTNIIDFN